MLFCDCNPYNRSEKAYFQWKYLFDQFLKWMALTLMLRHLEENLDDWLTEELENYLDDDYLVFDCPGIPNFQILLDTCLHITIEVS